jgi:hypothetical protein
MKKRFFASWLTRLVITLHISLALGYTALWFLTATRDQFWRGDFTAYYTGWAIMRDGKGGQLYDLDLQTRYQQDILKGKSFKDGLLPYINPPHATLIFTPLAWLPRQMAFWLWSAGQFGLLVWLLTLLWRIAQHWQRHEQALLLSAVCAFYPLFVTFMAGSFSLILLLATMQFYWKIKRHRELWSGLWLAVGSFKPQLMLMPGLITLGGRRWRVLISGIIITSVLVAFSLIYPGWQSWQGFFAVVQVIGNMFDAFGIVPTAMYNFKGTLTLLFANAEHALINRLSIAALGLSILATLWLWRGPWHPDAPTFELKMAISLLLGILFNPHLHPHDGLLLVAPATLFYAYLKQTYQPRHTYGAFALSLPLLFLVGEFTIGGSLGIRLPTLAMVVLLGWMVGKQVSRSGRLAATAG